MSLVKSYDGFETARLRLRQPLLSDAPTLFRRWTSDPDVARYVTWAVHTDVSQSEAFLRRCRAWWDDPMSSHAQFLVVCKDSGDAVGMFDLSRYRPRIGLGYVLAQDVWGRGLMTELILAVTNDLLTHADVHRVEALVDTENVASARVLDKAGFHQEATLRRYDVNLSVGPEPRDFWMYARVREDGSPQGSRAS